MFARLAFRGQGRALCGLLAFSLLVGGWQSAAFGQFCGGFGRFSAVGGISIDADGVVRNQTEAEIREVRQERADYLRAIPGDLKRGSKLRMISLRALDARLAEEQGRVQDRLDDVRFLAGLQRIQYIFVYPEHHDIVLAGPAEGWKVDARGHVVGDTTGRPAIMVDDLIVALRTADAAARTGLTCSIDPTPEGLQRLQTFAQTLSSADQGSVDALEQSMADALGMQNVAIAGVPADSHFARVMFAADYRLKRLAMAFDRSPVRGLPSYIQTVSGGKGVLNTQQRWWLSTNYEPIRKSPDGMAWEVRGQGVKCMTEDELLAGGDRQRTGEASPAAQRWADMFTAKYDELATREPIFGDLRNVMDLAVVAALIQKEGLVARAGAELPALYDAKDGADLTETLAAPRQVPTIAKAIKKGRNFIFSASGGVEIPSWQVTERVEDSTELDDTLARGAPREAGPGWWDAEDVQ
jgi:hypothetical protein